MRRERRLFLARPRGLRQNRELDRIRDFLLLLLQLSRQYNTKDKSKLPPAMFLPEEDDKANEHDGTLDIIDAMHKFAASPDERLDGWGKVLWAAYQRLQKAFKTSNTDEERWAKIEKINLERWLVIFRCFEKAFFPCNTASHCIMTWSRDMPKGRVGATHYEIDNNIKIKIDVRQSYPEHIFLTFLHEIVHALLLKHCCKGTCGEASYRTVWRRMNGVTGHAYYWQMTASAVELIVERFMNGPADMYRCNDVIHEMKKSMGVPLGNYLDTVLALEQANLCRIYLRHNVYHYEWNRLLRWNEMDMWGN